jgi:hypothetical protein
MRATIFTGGGQTPDAGFSVPLGAETEPGSQGAFSGILSLMKCILAGVLLGATVWAQGPVMDAVRPQYESARLNFTEAAEFMPEGDYGYRLSPAQRAYGDWVDHTMGMNLRLCSSMTGRPAPAPNPGDKSKKALLAGLKESFDYCDAVWKEMTEETALRELTLGGRKSTPLALMVTQVVQLNEHYGNMVGYLRTKGIVPPTTARAQKKKQ